MKFPQILSHRNRLGQPRSSSWHTASLVTLAVTLALIPWVVWPSAGDRFELPKLTVLAIGVGLAFVFWLTGVVSEKVITYPRSAAFAATLGVLAALGLSGAASAHFLGSAFGLPGTAAESSLAQIAFILLGLLLAVQLTDLDAVKRFSLVLACSLGLLALVGLYQSRGLPLIPPLRLPTFTFLADAPQTLAVIAALGVTLAIFFAMRGVEHLSRKVRWAIVFLFAVLLLSLKIKLGFALLTVGLVLLLVPVWWRPSVFKATAFVVPSVALGLTVLALLLLRPTGAPGTLSPKESTAVAVSTLTSSRTVVGMGPGLFSVAFNRFRPASYNAGENWTARPTSAGTEIAARTAEQGIIGLLAFLALVGFLLAALWHRVITGDTRKHEYPVAVAVAVGLTLLVVSAFLTPWTTALHFLFWTFVGFGLVAVESRRVTVPLEHTRAAPLLRMALTVASVAVVLGAAGWARVFWGDHLMGRAQQAIAATEDLSEVLHIVNNAVNVNPLDARPLALRSQATLVSSQIASSGQGQPDAASIASAVADAQAAIQRTPLDPAAIENLLAIVRSYGGIPETEIDSWFRRLESLDPRNPSVELQYGQFLLTSAVTEGTPLETQRSLLDHARAVFHHASELRANLPEAQFGEAIALTRLGRDAEAEPLLVAVAKAVPNQPVVALEYGQLLIRLKKFDVAVAVLKPSVEANPGVPVLVIALSDAYVGLGKIADARAVLEAALKEQPDDADLKAALAKLPK
jgi:thioredoxin-like negative regulator of GroEL